MSNLHNRENKRIAQKSVKKKQQKKKKKRKKKQC